MADEFCLLETMRLEDGEVPRLERHLARAAASAKYFGFTWDETAVRAAVASRQRAHGTGYWRLRLVVPHDGVPTVECWPHVLPNALPGTRGHGISVPWMTAFARNPVDEGDPLLHHKTTRRAVYETARRDFPALNDVILWNQRGEVTESTIANVIAEIDGAWCTPPVECGLLAGTLRAELLEQGTIRERVIRRDELAALKDFALINSLRGRIEARLVAV